MEAKQRDLQVEQAQRGRSESTVDLQGDWKGRGGMPLIQEAALDYTPPEYITLLLTDLGVLTPSAVSDELIKLYQ